MQIEGRADVGRQLGLKRVRGWMQMQVRAAGGIRLTAQPRQAVKHEPWNMSRGARVSLSRTMPTICAALVAYTVRNCDATTTGLARYTVASMRPGNPRPNGPLHKSIEARRESNV